MEWDRQGTDKATPTLALIEITATGDGTTVVAVQMSGLSAEDVAFHPQLSERCYDRIAAAFAVAEPGALPGRDPLTPQPGSEFDNPLPGCQNGLHNSLLLRIV